MFSVRDTDRQRAPSDLEQPYDYVFAANTEGGCPNFLLNAVV